MRLALEHEGLTGRLRLPNRPFRRRSVGDFIALDHEQFGSPAVMDIHKEAKMRKLLTAAMAAITLGGAVCATAAPAEAQRYQALGRRLRG